MKKLQFWIMVGEKRENEKKIDRHCKYTASSGGAELFRAEIVTSPELRCPCLTNGGV